jgi:hypothetical protein
MCTLCWLLTLRLSVAVTVNLCSPLVNSRVLMVISPGGDLAIVYLDVRVGRKAYGRGALVVTDLRSRRLRTADAQPGNPCVRPGRQQPALIGQFVAED